MNRKGRLQRLVIGIALALAGGTASAKAPHADAIIGGDIFSAGKFSAVMGANAIIGGDANAIIGGDANAIIGGDANAIIGGDRRKAAKPLAIIGGDANAIIGGDANAIIGGDRRKAAKPLAIIGGDANAIIGGDANAIIGGDRRKAAKPLAIIGGDANAIIGGDANAIIGGDANAIIGGDRRKAAKPLAIIGGDANAIIGGDANAIIGGDRRKAVKPLAIIGGDANAIIGGDANAIIGGDRRKAAKPLAIIGGDPRKLLALGPIDSINHQAGTVTVLGRTLKLNEGAPELDMWSASLATGVSPLVAVVGDQKSNGAISPRAVLNLNAQYVAGSTPVMLQGKVRAIDYKLGKVVIGNQLIDVTAATVHKRISIGTRVMVEGTQPALHGIVVADAIR
jgi:hypothetical protein